jgi:hypothetical protein
MSVKVKRLSAKTARIFDKYRALIKSRVAKTNNKYRSFVVRGNRSKNSILTFYLTNGRWPNRKAEGKRERDLGQRFENFIAKESGSYDPQLRRIVMALGRKSNHKRKHDVQGFKKEILAFIKEHGRVPSTSYQYQTNEGEARLRHKLDYYTQKKKDMTLLGKIYETDKCHLSGIPVKYRKLINESLDVEKPLIRLV